MSKKIETKKVTEFVTDAPLTVTDLLQFHDQSLPVFQEKWKVGIENERFQAYDHWSNDERSAIESTPGRQAYSFPIIAQKLNTILSMQRGARTSFRVEASQDPADDIKAELATVDLRDFERRTKLKYLESEVFQGGVAIQYGALEIYTDHDDDYNTVVMGRVLDYRDVIWDTNSRNYLLQDALWISKNRRRYRKDMREQYGEIANNVTLSDDTFSGAYSRNVQNYMVKANTEGKMDYDIISEITHFHKVERKYWCAMMDAVVTPDGVIDSQVVGKFRSKKEAEEKLKESLFLFLSQGIQVNGGVIAKNEWRYDKYVFSISGIISYEETELSDPPILVYRSFHYQDTWWTMADLLKDPQVFLDRYMSQVDFSLGTDVKNAYELDTSGLDTSKNSPEQAASKISKTGGVIYKNDARQIVHNIQSHGINSQYFELYGIMRQEIEDLGGGRSMSGLRDQKGESGKAIALKQAQGQMIAELFIDNLKRWKQYLGEVVLDWIKLYQNGERTIKVLGDSLLPEMRALLQQNNLYQESRSNSGTGFVKIPEGENGQSYLKDARLELVITEGELTETDRDQKLNQVLAISKITGVVPPLSVVLKYSDMDYSAKQEWQKAEQAQQQAQAEAMKAQQQGKQEDRNIEKAKVVQKGVK